MIAFVNATLIDGTGAAPRASQKVLVDGNKFHAIGKYIDIPPETIVYDLHGKTIVPGFIEAHSHLGNGYREGIASASETENYKDMRNLCLANGVTTIRSCADYKDEILSVRDMLNSGQLRGPRLVACGPHLMSNKAHPASTVWGVGDGTAENCGDYPETPSQGRELVRKYVDLGVDYIKIIISNYHWMVGKTPSIPDEVVEAIINESHKLGKTAVCHVENLEKSMMAAECGADELHHLLMMGHTVNEIYEFEPLFRKMCENNIWLCPTIVILHRNEPNRLKKEITGAYLEFAIRVFRRAYEFGVPIVCGTDAGRVPTPWGPALHAEMHSYVEDIGLTPLEAIRTATLNGAKALGLEGKVGQIKVGAYADLVVLDKDPSVDIHNSTTIRMVMHNGAIVWGEGAALTDKDMPNPERKFNFWNMKVHHI